MSVGQNLWKRMIWPKEGYLTSRFWELCMKNKKGAVAFSIRNRKMQPPLGERNFKSLSSDLKTSFS